MNETPSSTTERTVVVNDRTHARLWFCTIVSLCLNGLILLLLLFGAIAHHHYEKMESAKGGFGGGGGKGGGAQCHEHFHGGGGDFHHHFAGRDERGRGGMAWGGRGGEGDHHFGGGDEHGHFGGMDQRGHEDMRGHGFGGPGNFGPMRGEEDKGGMSSHDHHPMGGMAGGFHRGGKPPTPDEMTDGIVEHLTRQLTLTDDQKAKIKPIIQAQVTETQKEIQDQRQTLQTDLQKNFQDTKNKLKPILNADQQKLLDSVKLPGQKPDEKPGETATPAK